MFEKLYMIIGSLELLILLIIIGRYVYFEKFFYNLRMWYLFIGAFLFSEFVICFFYKDGEIQVLLPFLFFSILIFLSRKKNRIRGIFLVLPISGMMFSIIIIPISFLYLFSNSMNYIINKDTSWMGIFDIIFWICIIALLWKRRKWKNGFGEVANNRILSKWERNLINASGLFLLLFSVLVVCMDEVSIESIYAKFFVAFGILIVIFLESSILAMVVQGNGKAYFQQMAILNEHYLKSQLEHFKIYQDTQRETRRVYHDMKNHMICLHNLITDEKYEDASKYILDLDIQIRQIDKELHTGNDIVDAIVNEKYVIAKNNKISISIDGRIGLLSIDAIDLCTIFSNAIDNAVDALKNSCILHKEIQMKFKQQNEIQFIMFRNPVKEGEFKFTLLTTKKDTINHGFGLENIRMAVEKYKGNVKCYLENDGGQNFYVLEIILFMQPAT